MFSFVARSRKVVVCGCKVIGTVWARDPALATTHQSRHFDILAGMPRLSITLTPISRYSSELRPRLSTSGQCMCPALSQIGYVLMNPRCACSSRSLREKAKYEVRRGLQKSARAVIVFWKPLLVTHPIGGPNAYNSDITPYNAFNA
jgi:hypothetical protein